MTTKTPTIDHCPRCRKFLSVPEFIDQWGETCGDDVRRLPDTAAKAPKTKEAA